MLLNQNETPSARHYLILAMAWAGWVFDFYDLMLFSFLLVAIQRDLGLADSELSLLLGSSLAATAVGGLFFGWLADRVGRKLVLSATILTYSLGTFLCGFGVSLPALLLFRVITGLGVGGEWATGQTMVGETFPARMRARVSAVMQTGAPVGIALATVVGAFLEPLFAQTFGPSWGWRTCFFISVLPAALVIVIRRFLPESDIWEEWQRHPERAEVSGGDFLVSLRRDRGLRRLFLVGLVLAVTDMSAYWFTYSWMPAYLYDRLHFSMARSGVWMLVTQGGALLGYLSFGVIADRHGRRIAYSIYSVIWATGLLLVTWFWSDLVALPALILASMFLVGVGTGNFSAYGPIFAELFPTRIRNTAMGAAFNLARGVQFFTPLIITWVAAHGIGNARDLGLGISLGAGFALFTGIWVWVLPETRGTQIFAADMRREGDAPLRQDAIPSPPTRAA